MLFDYLKTYPESHGHIDPWAVDIKNGMNPRNGLCMNVLHEKAFDAGLISIDQNYRIMLSNKISEIDNRKSRLISDYKGIEISLPTRFFPDESLLAFNRDNIFLK